MLLLCEAVMFLAGLTFLINGKIKCSGRELTGSQARLMGMLLMSPPVIFLLMGFIVATLATVRADSMDALIGQIAMLTVIEIVAVIAVLVIFAAVIYAAPKIADSIMKKDRLLKPVLTVPEAALYLSITQEEVMHLIETSQIPAGRFGNQYRIARDMLDEYLQHE